MLTSMLCTDTVQPHTDTVLPHREGKDLQGLKEKRKTKTSLATKDRSAVCAEAAKHPTRTHLQIGRTILFRLLA